MKLTNLLLGLSLITASSAATLAWGGGVSGNWNAAANWNNLDDGGTKLPTASDFSIVNAGSTVTVNTAATTDTFMLSNTATTNTLVLEAGGTLTTSSGQTSLIAQNGAGDGIFRVNGGTFNGGSFFVGNVATGTGFIELNGGDFNFESINTSPGVALGVTSVNGDSADIDGDTLISNDGARLEFTFNATGISTIDLTGALNVTAGDLVINGSAYTGYSGGIETFTLVDASTYANQFDAADITVTGFDAFNYQVIQDSVTGNLSIQIPEPTSTLLLGLGSLGMLARRKR